MVNGALSGRTVMAGDPAPEDIRPGAFVDSHEAPLYSVYSALASVVNSDRRYKTSSLKRIIFPGRYSQPCLSPTNVYLVKLIANGARRCFVVDGASPDEVLYTDKREMYPELVWKAMRQIYSEGELSEAKPNMLVYRMIGWIPETLHCDEIGSATKAFDKLKKNLDAFAIIISFEFEGVVRPLLELHRDQSTGQCLFKTVAVGPGAEWNGEVGQKGTGSNGSNRWLPGRSDRGSAVVETRDWEADFNAGAFGNFYVNWNPAINKYRLKLHFAAGVRPGRRERFIESWALNNYRKTQVLVSLSPHSHRNECKFVFELSRRASGRVDYDVRVRLFGFNQTRMRMSTECYKENRIPASACFEVFADIMVFEECDEFDMYVMVIELLPPRESRPPSLPRESETGQTEKTQSRAEQRGRPPSRQALGGTPGEVMSLTCLCWFETEIGLIPFKKLVQTCSLEFDNLQNVVVQVDVLRPVECEFRIEGRELCKYRLAITHPILNLTEAPTHRDRHFHRDHLSQNHSMHARGNILTMFLEPGQYFVHVFESKLKSKPDFPSESRRPSLPVAAAKYTLEFLAFEEAFSDDFESSVREVRAREETAHKQGQVLLKTRCLETEYLLPRVVQKFALPLTHRESGQWHPSSNQSQLVADFHVPRLVHRNPGFVVLLNESCQLCVSVRLDCDVDLYRTFKVCVFEIDGHFDFKLLFSSGLVTTSARFVSDTLYLPQNANGYLVLVVPKFREATAHFEATFHSDRALRSVSPSRSRICHFPFSLDASARIDPGAGGSTSHHQFFLNRGFTLNITRGPKRHPEQLLVEVLNLDAASSAKIGFYVFPLTTAQPLCKFQLTEFAQPLSGTKVFFRAYNLHFGLWRPGKYLLVPTTFDPLESAPAVELSLRVFCTARVTLQPTSRFLRAFAETRQIRRSRHATFRLEVSGATRLMLVVKGVDCEWELARPVDFAISKDPTP